MRIDKEGITLPSSYSDDNIMGYHFSESVMDNGIIGVSYYDETEDGPLFHTFYSLKGKRLMGVTQGFHVEKFKIINIPYMKIENELNTEKGNAYFSSNKFLYRL